MLLMRLAKGGPAFFMVPTIAPVRLTAKPWRFIARLNRYLLFFDFTTSER
jgi:hypothetical protein